MANLLKISINEQFLDLGEARISLNYSSGRLQEIETRTGFSSYEITVPATTLNKSILNLSQQLSAKVYLDNNVINTGFIQVFDRNKVNKTYKLVFFSGNNNWFDLVNDKQLTETNLDSDAFLYNPNSVLKPPANIDFLAMNNGISFDERINNRMYWEELLPVIKTRLVFEKIFNDAGYNLEGSLLSDGKFNNDFIVLKDEGEGINESLKNKSTVRVTLFSNFSEPNPPEDFISFIVTGTEVLNNAFGKPFIEPTLEDVNRSVFKLNSNLVYDCFVNIRLVTSTNVNNIVLKTFIQDVERLNKERDVLEQLLYSNENRTSTTLKIENINPKSRELFSIFYKVQEIDPLLDYSINIVVDVKFTPVGGILKPENVNYPQLLLPDLPQADFIKELAVDYSILFDIDESSKTVFVDSFNILNKNKNISKNWDNKIINGDNETEDYIEATSNYGTLNNLTRSNNVGNGQFRLNNKLLPSNTNLFQSDFDGLEVSQLLGQSFTSSLLPKYSFETLKNIRRTDSGGIIRFVADNTNPILSYIEDPVDQDSALFRLENKEPPFEVGDLVIIKSAAPIQLTDVISYPFRIEEIRITKDGDSFTNVLVRPNLAFDSSIFYGDIRFGEAYLIKVESKDVGNVRVLRETVRGANLQTADTLTIVQFGLQTSLQDIRIGYFNKIINGTIQDINTDTLDYNNIINNYYPTIINTLNNNTYLRTEALLSEVDIRNLRFSIPIKYKNDYYYLDSIEEYNGQRATVNLIKI